MNQITEAIYIEPLYKMMSHAVTVCCIMEAVE